MTGTRLRTRPRRVALTIGLLLVVASLTLVPQASAAPTERTIAEIQGTGASSPLVGEEVVTRGVVTARYPAGGLRGFVVQTAGSGGALDLSTHRASDGLFVFLGSSTTFPAIGDHVSVQGTVSEYDGLTEVTASSVTRLAAAVRPAPARVFWPASEAERESLESMLLIPRGRYRVSDTYSLNQYAEIGLARGRRPLPQPTDVARPGAAAAAVAARNAERRLALDDGASLDFLRDANRDRPLPYLTRERPIRVGARVRFTRRLVLDYRNDAWKLQPVRQLTGDGEPPATFTNTRPARPRRVGGNVRIAGFNVLNYFTETGARFVRRGGTCTFHDDRDGNHVTVDSCGAGGPRGAADRADLRRQEAKIVRAVNSLGAHVVALQEVENSAAYAARRDRALARLVRALNADAGHRVWAYVRSPARRPAVADEDVIRTAFIYRLARVRPVGASRILVGDPSFEDAREPLAQVFGPRGRPARERFLVVVNHFKSKGSGVDDGTGQGLANPDRVAQAESLAAFAGRVRRSTGTRRVLLVGDFNAYTREDPVRVLRRAGYVDVGARFGAAPTYLFGGLVGSLDHVLANRAALRTVTGAATWAINSPESPAFEYSRFNYNATRFYARDPFRASDHDPLLVGMRTRR
jgi:5'-nucleotidase